jgi:transcriptional regulator with XRE-family HTH domain
MVFGEKVRALRKEKGISLRKFAAQAEISPTYLSKIERGEFPPPAEEKVKAMARLLGQNEDEFLALANRVASDLTGIIQERPKIWADFLRTVRGLPQDEMKRLLDQAREKASRQSSRGK